MDSTTNYFCTIPSHAHSKAAVTPSLERGEATDLFLDEIDPFEAAVLSMVRMYRSKRVDYAQDEDRWSNFRHMSEFMGCPEDPWMSALVLCQQKLSRIGALRKNGRAPQNEGVRDSILDNAVYAAIALAISKES